MDSIRIPPRIVDGDFTGWLRDAMNARGMSARMVGLQTGMNHSTITRLLSGDREPRFTTLIALLRLFADQASAEPIQSESESNGRPQDLMLL